eukprot:4362481-Amphidinium_carterae.1
MRGAARTEPSQRYPPCMIKMKVWDTQLKVASDTLQVVANYLHMFVNTNVHALLVNYARVCVCVHGRKQHTAHLDKHNELGPKNWACSYSRTYGSISCL